MTKFKYHYFGIPTKEKREGEIFLPEFKVYISGYDTRPFKIERIRFEDGAPSPELVKTVPHIAFEVDDLNETIKGKMSIASEEARETKYWLLLFSKSKIVEHDYLKLLKEIEELINFLTAIVKTSQYNLKTNS
jgi:hypothetical protein